MRKDNKKTIYSREELEFIERRNFEGWIHYNNMIVKLLYDSPLNMIQLRDMCGISKGDYFFNLINHGLDYGILIRNRSKMRLSLTEEAKEYYRKQFE